MHENVCNFGEYFLEYITHFLSLLSKCKFTNLSKLKKSVKIFKTKNSNFRNVKFFKNASGSAHGWWELWHSGYTCSAEQDKTSRLNLNGQIYTCYGHTKWPDFKNLSFKILETYSCNPTAKYHSHFIMNLDGSG